VVPAVVAIRFCTVRHFDTERAGYSVATGFIVDKKIGLILTNRHVVRPGPSTAEAILLDHEEIELFPIYRDPVHDFGFFRFNVEEVKFMEIEEIPLAPEQAKVGVEIRVIGNDAGEKLSILSGTLARLDRPAPYYGDDDYNDFNTFYYQAASSTSGGSSGSPVVNIAGQAIAMNAGGRKKAASSFYLPLNKVKTALEILRQNILDIPRGTIQTVFRHCPYDEVHRLGLTREREALVRKSLPNETGMLVVDQVIPNGPAHNLLEPGDILVHVNQRLLTNFIAIEEIFDSSVGRLAELEVERGGITKQISIQVQNLHSITPDYFLEVGGGILHALSYQQARNHRLPVGSVYVAAEGYMLGNAGITRGCIIKTIGQTDIPTMEILEKKLQSLLHGAHIPVQYFNVNDRHQLRLSVFHMDRKWHQMQSYKRNDLIGKWTNTIAPAYPKPDYVPQSAMATPLVATTDFASEMLRSIVSVSFAIPYVIDGGCSDRYIGAGLIVDAEKGLVVVDQNTVPMTLGDLFLTFGGILEIPGKVVLVHPIHNFSIIQYDPFLLKNGRFQSATLSSELLYQGDSVFLIGLTRSDQPFWQATTVCKVEELFIAEGRPPRFRATNEEVYHLEKAMNCIGGVIANSKGHVLALWASYSNSEKKNPSSNYEIFRGLPSYLLEDTLESLKRNEAPQFRSLEVELWPLSLSKARDVGLSENWIRAIEERCSRRHILSVRRLVAKSDAAEKLKTGDVLVAINGQLATTFREVETMTQSEKVQLTLVRNQEEIQVEVSPALLSGQGTDKVVCWSGAIIQNTHRAVAQLGFLYDGVYCSRWFYGSPAHKYGMRAVHWIVEINGKPTPNVDTFLSVVKSLASCSFLRLKLVGLQDKISVITLKIDPHYWSTWTLIKTKEGWCFEEPLTTSETEIPVNSNHSLLA